MVSSLDTVSPVGEQTAPPMCKSITCVDSDNADAEGIVKWYEVELDDYQSWLKN